MTTPKLESRRTAREFLARAFGLPGAMPKKIYAQAFPKLEGGRSLVRQFRFLTAVVQSPDLAVETLKDYRPSDTVYKSAVEELKKAGFDILVEGKFTIAIAGSPETFEAAFGVPLSPRIRDISSGSRRGRCGKKVVSAETGSDTIDTSKSETFKDILECVSIEETTRYNSASSLARYPRRRLWFIPLLNSCWHLHVPGGLTLALGADAAHRKGPTGRGIKIAVVDSGCMIDHPYFEGRGVKPSVQPTPDTSETVLVADPVGHGTAMCASVYGVAPDVELVMVRSVKSGPKRGLISRIFERPRGAPASVAAIQFAVSLEPDILSCSFSCGKPEALAAIIDAIDRGIVVVCCAGNDGNPSLIAQYPDVIAVGGVNLKPNGDPRASKYSSCYESGYYPGRLVPDVCGLIGARCSQWYQVLPVPPEADLGHKSGWRPANWGTSSATAQVAGVCALVLEANPGLKSRGGTDTVSKRVQTILRECAEDVNRGHSREFPSRKKLAAMPGPDKATGHGLVNAACAVEKAITTAVEPEPLSQEREQPSGLDLESPIPGGS